MAVQFVLSEELILSFWQEIIYMLIYLGLSFVGVSAIFVPLRDAFSYIEVEDNDLIIKNSYGQKERKAHGVF